MVAIKGNSASNFVVMQNESINLFMQPSERLSIMLRIRNFVKHRQPVGWTEIQSYLKNHDSEISKRTFDRYKEEMSNIGWVMIYKRRRGYILEEDENADIGEMIQLMNTVGHLTDQLNDLKEMKKYVQLSKSSFRGQEYLPDILSACIEKRTVRFNYTKYQQRQSYEVLLDPYQLRENDGRWYVVGMKHDSDQRMLRMYGLDRINSLEKGIDRFQPPDQEFIDNHFSLRMGVGKEKTNVPQRILLEVDAESWNWIESDPWHISQQKESEMDGKVRFSLFLVPNMQLQRNILSWAPKVVIVEPEQMRDTYIKEIFEPALKAHKNV